MSFSEKPEGILYECSRCYSLTDSPPARYVVRYYSAGAENYGRGTSDTFSEVVERLCPDCTSRIIHAEESAPAKPKTYTLTTGATAIGFSVVPK